MRRIWHRLFAARPTAGPEEDIAPESNFGTIVEPSFLGATSPTGGARLRAGNRRRTRRRSTLTVVVEPAPLAPFVDRQEYDDLMMLYQLARRKVLSQAEEIERLKAADPRPEVLPPDPG
jgi:hypothetical protein